MFKFLLVKNYIPNHRMFSLWSVLNSSLEDEVNIHYCMIISFIRSIILLPIKESVTKKLDSLKSVFKSSLGTYYKQADATKTKIEDARLKKNENELIKRISEYLVNKL